MIGVDVGIIGGALILTLSEAKGKDLRPRILGSFAVSAAQDDAA